MVQDTGCTIYTPSLRANSQYAVTSLLRRTLLSSCLYTVSYPDLDDEQHLFNSEKLPVMPPQKHVANPWQRCSQSLFV